MTSTPRTPDAVPAQDPSVHPQASVPGVLDARLLAVLACPTPHRTGLRLGRPGAPQSADAATSLFCPECGRVFPVRDGIPVLLLDEAEPPDHPVSP